MVDCGDGWSLNLRMEEMSLSEYGATLIMVTLEKNAGLSLGLGELLVHIMRRDGATPILRPVTT